MGIHRRNKRAILSILALLTAGLAILATFGKFLDTTRLRLRQQNRPATLSTPKPLLTQVALHTLAQKKQFPATLEPWLTSEIPSEIAGRITHTFIEPGQLLTSGQPIARLDSRRAEIALSLAEARHQEATRLLKEAQRLKNTDALSRSALEAATAQTKITLAQLEDARDLLARHTITAPFDATVETRLTNPGEAVNPGQPVARIVDTTRLRVKFSAPAADLPGLTPGTSVAILPSPLIHHQLTATIRHVSPSASEATGLFDIEAELPNPSRSLPGGIPALVEATVHSFTNQPAIPSSAVTFDSGQAFVLIHKNDQLLPSPVRLGPLINGLFPVLEGLQPGDQILLSQ